MATYITNAACFYSKYTCQYPSDDSGKNQQARDDKDDNSCHFNTISVRDYDISV